MAAESGNELVQVVALLGAGVVAVPLFRRLGLGSVLGYLAAGVAIGPFGTRLFSDPQAILHIAELGVVMFLFVIGLEMQPSRLWSLRRQIFGLGAAAGERVRRAADAGRRGGGLAAAGGLHRRHGLRAVVHGGHHADAERARRYGDAAGPEDGVDPAAGGPRHRAAAGHRRLLRAGDGHRAALGERCHRGGVAGLPGGRGAVAAQPAVPGAGRSRRRAR